MHIHYLKMSPQHTLCLFGSATADGGLEGRAGEDISIRYLFHLESKSIKLNKWSEHQAF